MHQQICPPQGCPFLQEKGGRRGRAREKVDIPSHVADAEGNVIELSKPMHGLDNPDEISKDSEVEEYTGDDSPKGPPQQVQLRSQRV